MSSELEGVCREGVCGERECVPFSIYLPSLLPRSTRGKGNEAFKQSVVDLLHTASSMLKVECPENELITPRVVSGSNTFHCLCVLTIAVVLSASTNSTVLSTNNPSLSSCNGI